MRCAVPETSWETIQRLCGEVGMEPVWDTVWVRHPDLVCEPMVDEPWSDSGARVEPFAPGRVVAVSSVHRGSRGDTAGGDVGAAAHGAPEVS